MGGFKRFGRALAWIVIIGLPLYFIIAAFGTKFGLLDMSFGFGKMVFAWGKIALGAALAIATLSFIIALIPHKVRGYKKSNFGAVILALIAAAFPLYGMYKGKSFADTAAAKPFIHDVSTDRANPPMFSANIMEERGEGSNPVNYIGKMTPRGDKLNSAAQAEGYPEITSTVYSVPRAQVAEAAQSVMERKFGSVTSKEADGETVLEATHTSFWFGFKDDVVVRIRDYGNDGSQVDMRSISRVGGSDVGANAARIEATLDGISNKLGVAPEAKTELTAADTDYIDAFGRDFVILGLHVGQYDKDYVDAYTGDPQLMAAAKANPMPLETVRSEADALLARANALMELPGLGDDTLTYHRVKLLRGDTLAMQTRLRMAQGEELSFNEEAELLYGAVPPQYNEAYFASAKEELDAVLPGEGEVGERLAAFESSIEIPEAMYEPIMRRAIAECRAKTAEHYALPEGENFVLEFVSDKSWSGYNWYQGQYQSLIQINTDQPLRLDRAVDLGCHEGYPGHHMFNLRVEQKRINEYGWPEAEIQPLFSPQSPLMEGSANYGIELAFPGEERVAFERDVLYPMAGVDPSLAAKYREVSAAMSKLSHVQTHVAREYLDGRMSREEAEAFLVKYRLVTPSRAKQMVDFSEKYRAYVLNYAMGQDIVRAYIDREAAGGKSRWEAFEYILDVPVTLADLQESETNE